MQYERCLLKKQKYIAGFTLIELVVCMVILAILSSAMTSFLGNGTQLFVETAMRTDLSVLGRNIALRLERQFSKALPYSFLVSDDKKQIRFKETVGGFRIQSIELNPDQTYKVSFFSLHDAEQVFLDSFKRCQNYGVTEDNYKLYPAFLHKGGNLSIKDAIKKTDLVWLKENNLLFFSTSSDIDTLSTGARLYFLDNCSDVAYQSDNGILKYSVYEFEPNNLSTTKLESFELNGDPVLVKELRFSASGTNVSFGMLLWGYEQSIPISKYVEVANVP